MKSLTVVVGALVVLMALTLSPLLAPEGPCSRCAKAVGSQRSVADWYTISDIAERAHDAPEVVTADGEVILRYSKAEMRFSRDGEAAYTSDGSVLFRDADVVLQVLTRKGWQQCCVADELRWAEGATIRHYTGSLGTEYTTAYTVEGDAPIKLTVDLKVGQTAEYRLLWRVEGIVPELNTLTDTQATFGNTAGSEFLVIDWSDVVLPSGGTHSSSIVGDALEIAFSLGVLKAGSEITVDPSYLIGGKRSSFMSRPSGRDSSGNLWYVWADRDGTGALGCKCVGIMKSTDSGQTWQLDTTVAQYHVGEDDLAEESPTLVLGPEDYWTVVTVDVQGPPGNPQYQVWMTWGKPGYSATKQYVNHAGEEFGAIWEHDGPVAVIDLGNELWIWVTDEDDGTIDVIVYNWNYATNAWVYLEAHADVAPDDSHYVDSCATSDGNVHVIWTDYTNGWELSTIKYRRYNGTSWTGTAEAVSSAGGDCEKSCPRLVSDSNDNVHLAYHRKCDDTMRYKYKASTATWSSSEMGTAIAYWASSYEPLDLAFDDNGRLHILWAIPDGGLDYMYSDDFAEWSSVQHVVTGIGPSNHPTLMWARYPEVGGEAHGQLDFGAAGTYNIGYVGYFWTNAFYTVDYPTVQTLAATAVEETTATLEGHLVDAGGENCQYSFEYDTNSGVPYGSSTTYTGDIGDDTAFDEAISSLTEGELYYYRARARNSQFENFGSEIRFLTKPLEPDWLSASASRCDKVELAWGLGDGADAIYIRREIGSYPTDITDGTLAYSGGGSSASDSGLTPSTTYYYRAWSRTSEGGLAQYSDLYVQNFATTPSANSPWVVTNEATNVGEGHATLNGYLEHDGGMSCQYRFEYGTSSGPPYDQATTWAGSITAGDSFTSTITDVLLGQTYYFRAQAKNTAGTSSGVQKTFTTLPEPPTSFTCNSSVTSECTLTWVKGVGSTNTMIRWSPDHQVTSTSSDNMLYFGTGNTTTHQYLEPGRTYYYSAWGETGDLYSVTYATCTCTTSGAPTVVTRSAVDIGVTKADLRGYLSVDGGLATSVWFEYDTDSGAPYTYSTDSYLPGSAPQDFQQTVGNYVPLTADTTYYFRAVGENTEGTSYGSELSFATWATLNPPTNFLSECLTDASTQLAWTPGVGSTQTLVRYKVGSYPADPSDGTYVCLTDDNSAIHTGLTPGITYYYSAWGEDNGAYSTSKATDIATTSCGPGPTQTPYPPSTPPWDGPTPTPGPGVAPPNWWTTPTCAKVQNLPGFGLLTTWYTQFETPSGTTCMFGAFMLILVFSGGTFVMTKGHVGVALVVMLVFVVIFSALWLVPGWILLILILVSGGGVFAMSKLR